MSRPEREYDELVSAYQNAEYRVASANPFSLRIGIHSEELALLMEATGARSAALITSDNPYSLKRDPKANREAKETLLARLSERVEHLIPAVGLDPSGNWPGEEGFLALDLNLGWAKPIACMFGQNAFVYAEADAVPRLILTASEQL